MSIYFFLGFLLNQLTKTGLKVKELELSHELWFQTLNKISKQEMGRYANKLIRDCFKLFCYSGTDIVCVSLTKAP